MIMNEYYYVDISVCGVYGPLEHWDSEFEIILLVAGIYIYIFSMSFLSCVGIGLAIGQSPI